MDHTPVLYQILPLLFLSAPLIPGFLAFVVATRSRGWLRIVLLLAILALPALAFYDDYACETHAAAIDDIDEPCLLETFVWLAGLMAAGSTFLGTVAGFAANRLRRPRAKPNPPITETHA